MLACHTCTVVSFAQMCLIFLWNYFTCCRFESSWCSLYLIRCALAGVGRHAAAPLGRGTGHSGLHGCGASFHASRDADVLDLNMSFLFISSIVGCLFFGK